MKVQWKDVLLHIRWWLEGKPCYCGADEDGHGRFWEPRPMWCVGININVAQHHVADVFWKYWQENGETHKHVYYESTWGAINAAINAAMDAKDDA